MTESWLYRYIQESNAIEGITREPTPEEITAHEVFLAHDELTLEAVVDFVSTISTGQLRDKVNLDVRVGKHFPPPGHPDIKHYLASILHRACTTTNSRGPSPYEIHLEYESLHPFTDGNGRSGRAIWLWMMLKRGREATIKTRLFLHEWYYQSLEANQV